MILAGDIGGTNTRLACYSRTRGGLKLVDEQIYPSRNYASLGTALHDFIAQIPGRIEAACLGVAGPVIDGRCKTTNLPWVVDRADIIELTQTPHVGLLNDLEATAHGIDDLAPADLKPLQIGTGTAQGNRAVIAAGTGLGEAGLFWNGRGYLPFASEGGHCDFAPRDELQIELLQFSQARFEHVSWERVLSGPGLVHLYQFFLTREPDKATPSVAAEIVGNDAAAAVISQAALEKRCPLCVAALDLFVSLYGAEAGNLALKLMACGGLYLAGGIAPKILPALCQPTFLAAMATGRFQSLLQSIPVYVVLTDRAALLGAAHYAKDLLRTKRQ